MYRSCNHGLCCWKMMVNNNNYYLRVIEGLLLLSHGHGHRVNIQYSLPMFYPKTVSGNYIYIYISYSTYK